MIEMEGVFAGYKQTDMDAFRAYHAANSWIWVEFKRFAQEVYASGRKRYGAKSIMERIRWEFEMKHPGNHFKINNDFTAFYARTLAYNDARFANFFEFREAKGLKVKGASRG